MSDFDVETEAAELLRWVRCAAPAHTSIEPRPEVMQVLLRAIAHGRRQGAEEMRERVLTAIAERTD